MLTVSARPEWSKTKGTTTLFGLMLMVLASMACTPTHAAESGPVYPTKPVRFIVPQPPGGALDIVARLLAHKLGESLGQNIIIDNRSGAGGVVGTEVASKAPPDGYTLLLGTTGILAINPTIYKKLPYRPLLDLDPISLLAASPFLMVVHPSLDVASVAELVAAAKKRPAGLTYSTPGNGTLHHLSMEWFKSSTGANLVHVPYKGAQAFNAVIAGEVSLAFGSVVAMLPHVKSGRVKAIAITSKGRSRLLPDLPTVAESGVPRFEATNWFGVLAPRGTPPQIISRLGSLIAASMSAPEMKERLSADGADPIGSTPEAFANLIKAELARWAQVVKTSGAKVD